MALPFNLMNLVARAPANKVVDQNLIEAEKTFGIPDFVMAEDMVDYYKDAPPNLDIQPRPGAINPNISGIYNPNLLPLNFSNDNDNDRDNLNNITMGLGSPDLVDINDDMYRFDDTVKKKGIMEILGMLPTPFNLARKGIEFFNDYREKKEIEKQREIEAAKILEQMKQERIKNEQIAKEKKEQAQRDAVENARQRNEREGRGGYQSTWAGNKEFMQSGDEDGDGGGGGQGLGGDQSGPGGSDSMGSFAYGGQVRRNYFNGGIVSLRGKI